MDERKRTFDQETDGSVGQPKRVRPEEILGPSTRDPHSVVTRVLLDRSNFSKVIGRSGKTISTIRATTGASVTGTNLSEEDRLVVLAGSVPAVVAAFGTMLQILFPAGHGSPSASTGAHVSQHAFVPIGDRVSVTLLLEHSRAGRVVGPRGSTLQNLKQRSGAAITIEKVPMDCAGVQLRKVSLDGAAAAVTRAHLYMHELFVDDAASAGCGRGQQGGEAEGWRTPATPRPSGSYPPSPSTGSVNSERPGASSYSAGATFLAMSDAFGRSLPTDCEDGVPPAGRHAGARSSTLAEPSYDPHFLPPPAHMFHSQQFQPTQPLQLHQQEQQHHLQLQQQQQPQQQFVRYFQAPQQQAPPPQIYHMVTLPQPGPASLLPPSGPVLGCGSWQASPGHSQPHPSNQTQDLQRPQPSLLAVDHQQQGEQAQHVRREAAQRSEQHLGRQPPASPASAHAVAKVSGWASLPAEPRLQEASLPGIAESTSNTQPAGAEAAQSEWVAPLSASALLGWGVPAKEVGQLVDLQTFLLRNFGLELAIAKAPELKDRAHPSASQSGIALLHEEPSSQKRADEGEAALELVLAERRLANPHAAYLPVPSACVGGLIGRGGQTLRELQAEFGVRVYVEKEDYMGQRIVSLVYVGNAAPASARRHSIDGAAGELDAAGSDSHAADAAHREDGSAEDAPHKSQILARTAGGAEGGDSAQSITAAEEPGELPLAGGKGRCRGREDKEEDAEAETDGAAAQLLGRAQAFKRNRTDTCGDQESATAVVLDARTLPQTSLSASAIEVPSEEVPSNLQPAVSAAGANHKKRDGASGVELEERTNRKVLKVSRGRNAPTERASTPTGRSRASSAGASSDAEADEGEAGEHSGGEQEAAGRAIVLSRGRSLSSPTPLATAGNNADTLQLSTVDVGQQAISRCRERIEAMAEDILQSQIRDVRIT